MKSESMASKGRPNQGANPISGSARPSQARSPKEGGSRNAKVGTERLSIPTPKR